MSSLVQGSQQTPNSQRPLGIDVVRSVDSGIVILPGSFAGFVTSTTVNNYDPTKTRGNFFTVSPGTPYTSAATYTPAPGQLMCTGRYKVTLNGILPITSYSGVQPTQAPGTTASPGWPNGLILQPQAYITNGVGTTASTDLPLFFATTPGGVRVEFFINVYCTPFNASTNSFEIWTYGDGALPNYPKDVTAADRLNFTLSFKVFGFTP